MKNLAKLTLFFSLSFAILFLAAVLLRLLSSRIGLVRFIPVGAVPGEDAAQLAWKALPAAIYFSVLFSASYTVRRKIPALPAVLCVFALGSVFTLGISLGIDRAGALEPALNPVAPIEGKPGLILSRPGNAVILLKESSDVRGPRVVSLPSRPLIYQAVPAGPGNTVLGLPSLPFGIEQPWFIRSLGIDFSLSAGEMERRMETGMAAFAAYAFSLLLLLCSLRFIMELSQWPLAGLFLGALVYRLILTLETFLNTREINALLVSFLAGRVPPLFVTPLVFSALGAVFIFYSLLAFSLKSGGNRDD